MIIILYGKVIFLEALRKPTDVCVCFFCSHIDARSPVQWHSADLPNRGRLIGFLSSHSGFVNSSGPFNLKHLSRRRHGTLSLAMLFGTQGASFGFTACRQAGLVHL